MFKQINVILSFVAVVSLTTGCAKTVPVTADSLTLHASTRWQREAPEHASRRLQFRIRSDHGGVEDAKLILWNFPHMRDAGDGRVIQMNMDRWIDQFAQDDGMPSGNLAKMTEYRVNGMEVHTIDIAARYVSVSSPGSGVRTNLPGYRTLGAYLVAPQGDYIAKLWGPASVVSQHAAAFDMFVKSARPADAPWDQDVNEDGSQARTTLAATEARP